MELTFILLFLNLASASLTSLPNALSSAEPAGASSYAALKSLVASSHASSERWILPRVRRALK